MNKTNVERSLAILDADLARGGTSERGRPDQRKGIRRATLPGDFPPGVHPDDWEPDDEVERGPVIADPTLGQRRW